MYYNATNKQVLSVPSKLDLGVDFLIATACSTNQFKTLFIVLFLAHAATDLMLTSWRKTATMTVMMMDDDDSDDNSEEDGEEVIRSCRLWGGR